MGGSKVAFTLFCTQLNIILRMLMYIHIYMYVHVHVYSIYTVQVDQRDAHISGRFEKYDQ